MADVLETVKSILTRSNRETSSRVEAVRLLLEGVRKEIVVELATASADSFSAFRQKQVLASIERYLQNFESAAKAEAGQGLKTMWEAGGSLVTDAAAAGGAGSGVWFGFNHLSSSVLESLKEFTYGRISNVTGSVYDKIRAELTLGVLGQKTPQDIAAAIAVDIKDKPLPVDRWQNPIFKNAAERAEVITSTEMGRAFSMASQLSMETATTSVPGLKKLWLHAGHPRMPRQVHLLMHGQTRDIDQPFYQTAEGAPVMFPRDPNAPIKEVIRCGCQHVPHMEEWGNADAFAAEWDRTQVKVNKPKGA